MDKYIYACAAFFVALTLIAKLKDLDAFVRKFPVGTKNLPKAGMKKATRSAHLRCDIPRMQYSESEKRERELDYDIEVKKLQSWEFEHSHPILCELTEAEKKEYEALKFNMLAAHMLVCDCHGVSIFDSKITKDILDS